MFSSKFKQLLTLHRHLSTIKKIIDNTPDGAYVDIKGFVKASRSKPLIIYADICDDSCSKEVELVVYTHRTKLQTEEQFKEHLPIEASGTVEKTDTSVKIIAEKVKINGQTTEIKYPLTKHEYGPLHNSMFPPLMYEHSGEKIQHDPDDEWINGDY